MACSWEKMKSEKNPYMGSIRLFIILKQKNLILQLLVT
jgi:hypothetical protein